MLMHHRISQVGMLCVRVKILLTKPEIEFCAEVAMLERFLVAQGASPRFCFNDQERDNWNRDPNADSNEEGRYSKDPFLNALFKYTNRQGCTPPRA